MAKVGVSLKIDVTKIDKARLFKGQKGTYLDATVFIDLGEADQYGNHGMITQDVSKEERQQGSRGEILGNCKVFFRDEQPQQQRTQQPQQNNGQQYRDAQNGNAPQQNNQSADPYDDFNDSIPF